MKTMTITSDDINHLLVLKGKPLIPEDITFTGMALKAKRQPLDPEEYYYDLRDYLFRN